MAACNVIALGSIGLLLGRGYLRALAEIDQRVASQEVQRAYDYLAHLGRELAAGEITATGSADRANARPSYAIRTPRLVDLGIRANFDTPGFGIHGGRLVLTARRQLTGRTIGVYIDESVLRRLGANSGATFTLRPADPAMEPISTRKSRQDENAAHSAIDMFDGRGQLLARFEASVPQTAYESGQSTLWWLALLLMLGICLLTTAAWAAVRVVGRHSVRGIVDRRNSRRAATMEVRPEILESAVEGIAHLGPDGLILSVNPPLAEMLGGSPEGPSESHWASLVARADHELVAGTLKATSGTGKTQIEARINRADGGILHAEVMVVADDEPGENSGGHYLFIRNISHKKAAEAEIAYQANHDTLTGLPNRGRFVEMTESALRRAKSGGTQVAVMFLDLDNFKYINDSLGHDEGDRLLVRAAQALQSCVRHGDTVARLGGDEFTILLEEISNPRDVLDVAERIVERMSEPIRLTTREVFTSTSIGVAFSHGSDIDYETLLRNADTAMYQAKSNGKAGFVVFDKAMNDVIAERLQIEHGLRQALQRGEFRNVYQPIVNLLTGEILEVEALVRWEDPSCGLVAPSRFIPIAEETDLIVPLGCWVLEEACRQTRRWHADYPGIPPVTVCVNLSHRQLRRSDIVSTVQRILGETGLSPSYLRLEITESGMLRDAETLIARLNALCEMGVRLSIDDFGTGFSSLSYLRRLPIDTVKIDRSFVRDMDPSAPPDPIVVAIIQLSKALGKSVIAEGVETSRQLAQLRDLGCECAQGFFFGQPLVGAIFAELLSHGPLPLTDPQADASAA